MKGFIKKIILFSIPIILTIFIFISFTIIIHKPHVKDVIKIEESKVKLNRGNYIFNLFKNLDKKPNSFIFGGSRSQAIRADSLTEKTKNKFNFFHFDSSSENIKGIENKINYLIQKNHEIKTCLIILDEGLLSEDDCVIPQDFHLITPPYKLTKNIILYKQYILTFTNPRFLIGSIDYYIFKRYRNYMKRFFKEPSFNEKINPKTGDITYSAEFMIENDSVKYYTKMRKSGHFIQLEKDKNQNFYPKTIEILNDIKNKLEHHEINYLVVLTPRYKKLGVSTKSIKMLKDNKINFLDLSFLEKWNYEDGLWYENSHFRRLKIGKYIENEIIKEIN
tara:strand:+ start:346 stop:1347 length:1002 start_codon:yes stop_codon:yes gene_type:complete